jgi:AcrR family transcriptional regulator
VSKRSRRLPREQRRRTLVEAAREIVVQRGYLELTMGRVASKAGVSKTLVYDHFAHRRELYLAVLAEEQVRLVQRLAPALAYGDREQRVRSGVRAFLELVEEYGDGWAEVFRNPIAQDPELAMELRRVRDGVAEMLAGIIAGDVGMRPESVLLHAHALVGTMESSADWLTRLPPDRRPALDVTTEVLSLLIWQGLDGLRSLSPPQPASGDEPVPLRPRRDAGSR